MMDRWKVKSTSDRRKRYTITRKGRKFQCSCPRWIHRSERTDCKHITALKQQLSAA